MAYGAIPPPINTAPLPTLAYPLPNGHRLTIHPVTAHTAPLELAQFLHGVFNEELASGRTYPQEGPLTLEAFTAYFFGATALIGVVSEAKVEPGGEGERVEVGLEEACAGRKWEECVGGTYYVKPNYPGRASHNCASFLIPPTFRGLKIGKTLGKSYLFYGPALGYRGSVFNLVFKNNYASLAIWDSLGFSRVGLIPKAGRLKTGPNGEEEYVDAVVIWKSFVEGEEEKPTA
ncbi:hypothetical protein NliqN6_3573 [Naganishia liquefaciens]|uniref:N-acetyltransferase domain-containing protein n=1 Tax=Naganishia liquefaciens TaxID=104408 RepID=A0A8H3TUH4_9TREE|nr:hypothetical protein NliqN6_3573 [Naganishia liquefaciens]